MKKRANEQQSALSAAPTGDLVLAISYQTGRIPSSEDTSLDGQADKRVVRSISALPKVSGTNLMIIHYVANQRVPASIIWIAPPLSLRCHGSTPGATASRRLALFLLRIRATPSLPPIRAERSPLGEVEV